MKNVLLWIVFLMTISFASTFNVTGTCLTDISSNDTYCGDNSTLYVDNITNITILNVTNITVLNITYNITNITNTSVYMCNETNGTAWANSSLVLNNATFTCLSNATVVNMTNISNITNTTVQNITNCTIPSNYCYQNISESVGFLALFRNDACNITLTTSACLTSCPTCETCTASSDCEVCQEASNCTTQNITECAMPEDYLNMNNSVVSLSYQNTQLSQENYKLTTSAAMQKNATEEGKKAAQEAVGITPYLILIVLGLFCLGAGIALAYRAWDSRRHTFPENYPSSMSEQQRKDLLDAGSPIIVRKK